MSFNTIGYRVANNYLQAQFNLKEEEFNQLLSENIEIHHATNGYESKMSGRDKVMAIYKEKFFDVTSDFDIYKVEIQANGLQPEFICKVSETKKEGNVQYRAKFCEHTILHLVQEEGKYKIKKIISIVSKEILS